VQRRLLLDVVVRQRAAVFELLTSEDQALLIRRDAFLVLDLGLYVLDRVRAFNVQRDGLAGQRLEEICIPPRRRSTRCSVDSFWML